MKRIGALIVFLGSPAAAWAQASSIEAPASPVGVLGGVLTGPSRYGGPRPMGPVESRARDLSLTTGELLVQMPDGVPAASEDIKPVDADADQIRAANAKDPRTPTHIVDPVLPGDPERPAAPDEKKERKQQPAFSGLKSLVGEGRGQGRISPARIAGFWNGNPDVLDEAAPPKDSKQAGPKSP